MTEQCCPQACNGGGCETCRCCTAGWCVLGTDGLPGDPADLAGWVAVARVHNPIVEAWATVTAERDDLRSEVTRLRADGHPRTIRIALDTSDFNAEVGAEGRITLYVPGATHDVVLELDRAVAHDLALL